MNYQQTIQYLFTSAPVFEKVGASAYKPGLQTTEALDAHLSHPHRQYKTIHIAGTNGKGSCSHTLAAILQAEGYKVGLYTSPHLVDFRERIRVNGECLPEDYVVDFVAQHRAFFEPLHPSFFELTTAMAFRYFADQQVDIAVIEVGLGGRLDCTNIITPILSIITNISLDHTQFLGHTLPEIASEKAGIIKPGVPVFVSEATAETRPVFIGKARVEEAPIIFVQDKECRKVVVSHETPEGRQYLLADGTTLTGQLGGQYQEANANLILCVSDWLLSQGILRHPESVSRGLREVCQLTGLRGRWERIQDHPLVVCDTGHNVAAWQYLVPQICSQPCRQLRIVFGMVDDKDVDTVMQMLPKTARYYWAQATTHRAIPVEKIAEKGRVNGLEGALYHSVKEAYKVAMSDAHADDFIFVGGSSYVVADFLAD